jgi:hypothetical protein
MKPILLSLFLVVASFVSRAQFYNFSHFTEQYQQFSDGALMDFDSICGWENEPPLVSIGFQMPYFNMSFSEIGVDQNFLLSKNLATVPGEEIFAQLFAFGAAYDANPSSFSSVRFKTVGTLGSRIFKLQFRELTIYNDSVGADRCNYQIWMYEGIGRIEYRIGSYQISQEDGFFTFENGVLSGIALYDNVNDVILPGSIFLTDYPDNPTAFLNSTVEFIPTVIGYPSDGRVYRFDNVLLGIDAVNAAGAFEIYPNPASSSFEIKGDLTDASTFMIYDSKSKLIGSYTNSTINVENLQTGVYFVVIENSDGSVTKKFVKN